MGVTPSTGTGESQDRVSPVPPPSAEIERLHRSILELSRIVGKQEKTVKELAAIVEKQGREIADLLTQAQMVKELVEKYRPAAEKFLKSGFIRV